MAEKLELAGQTGDTKTLDAELDGLLARYRALGTALSPLCSSAAETRDDRALPLIPDDALRSVYSDILKAAASFDADRAEYALSRLDGFRIPESEHNRVGQLRRAVSDLDLDRISEFLNGPDKAGASPL